MRMETISPCGVFVHTSIYTSIYKYMYACKKRNRSHTQTHNKKNTTHDTTRTTPQEQQHNRTVFVTDLISHLFEDNAHGHHISLRRLFADVYAHLAVGAQRAAADGERLALRICTLVGRCFGDHLNIYGINIYIDRYLSSHTYTVYIGIHVYIDEVRFALCICAFVSGRFGDDLRICKHIRY